MRRLIACLLLACLSACITYSGRESTAAFASRYSPSHAELTTMLLQAGWLIQDEQFSFHEDPRGFVGDRYELQRTDSRGLATVFIFTAEHGNGSVIVSVSERVSDDRMFELFASLRKLCDAAPSWRDAGVAYCTDHDPRHVAQYSGEADLKHAKEKLRAQSGCGQLRWNLEH